MVDYLLNILQNAKHTFWIYIKVFMCIIVSKKTKCFLGEMPRISKVKVKETAHFLYWGTINYHRMAYFYRTLSKNRILLLKASISLDAFILEKKCLLKTI